MDTQGSAPTPPRVVNAFSIDVEEYFQVSALEPHITKDRWDSTPSRVEHSVRRILELLSAADYRATFFILGWIAERHPKLVREIAEAGHEIASHGYEHTRVTKQTAEQFREDVRRTKRLLEDTVGCEVVGYRAASFSIGAGNLWALDVLNESGYRYSSSIYPVKHDLYGMPEAPRFAFKPNGSALTEIPVSTVTLFGRNWPCGGGGFFRLFPYALSRWAMAAVNEKERQPIVFYFHPWEIDPDQPRVRGVSFRTRIRHYLNLGRTADRLRRLLEDFQWDRMDRVFAIR
jgi:polysaccharide deacetylase family protein (PEP-CTERM system associated)